MSITIDEILLQVQKKEVEVFDLSLTELAQNYPHEEESLFQSAKFIAGLAHLIYLKAKGLVPKEEEEEAESEDSEELKLQSVEEYAAFRDVAKSFSLKMGSSAGWR